MNDTAQPTSRMAKLREQASKGELGRTTIANTGRRIIAIDRVVEDPENERKTFDDMDDLVASVRAHGLVEPPTVTEIDGERYQLVTGHRRVRAAQLVGLTQIEVLIREPEEKWQRRKKSLVSNIQRADIRPIELAISLKALLDADPKIQSQDDLALAVGKPKSWVSDMLRILDLPHPLQEKVQASALPLSADAVSKIARVTDEEVQSRLVGQLVQGASARAIREAINVHKGGAPKKPKWVWHTEHGADVILQAQKARLTRDERIAALQDALRQMKAERG